MTTTASGVAVRSNTSLSPYEMAKTLVMMSTTPATLTKTTAVA